jgi:hypothetical protein
MSLVGKDKNRRRDTAETGSLDIFNVPAESPALFTIKLNFNISEGTRMIACNVASVLRTIPL